MRFYTIIDHALEKIVGQTPIPGDAAAGALAYLDAIDPATDIEWDENKDGLVLSCYQGPTLHVYASLVNVDEGGRVHITKVPTHLTHHIEDIL